MDLLFRTRIIKALVMLTLIFGGLHCCHAAEKLSIATASVDGLFDLMEKRTEKIDSLKVDVVLENTLHKKNCCLSIMNPDKFAIEFDDASIQAFFDGKKLWLKIAELKEVFYHFSDADNSWWSYVPLFSPRKIFTNLTRKTLFTLFNIELVEALKDTGSGHTIYTLKFIPKMRSVFREVFSVGHYLMLFSDETCLPIKVLEFDPDGNERGKLTVIKYYINTPIPAENFEFTPPPGYTLVPFSVVFAQKLEECGKFLVNKIGEAAANMKKTILDWGF
ncbi:MAG: hypothetical protein PWR01_3067 [Clostridiales bacterium]|jgi:outer membrane lipoprotein-sorting protein|nr:hypothetical protein [Clostridiales bacterium]MDN5281994.1 hypothetical protein [Candidatus Ozemobacter sp.]